MTLQQDKKIFFNPWSSSLYSFTLSFWIKSMFRILSSLVLLMMRQMKVQSQSISVNLVDLVNLLVNPVDLIVLSTSVNLVDLLITSIWSSTTSIWSSISLPRFSTSSTCSSICRSLRACPTKLRCFSNWLIWSFSLTWSFSDLELLSRLGLGVSPTWSFSDLSFSLDLEFLRRVSLVGCGSK